MNKNIPIYDLGIDPLDDSKGVSFISLVDEPAIMVDFIKLAKEQAVLKFKAADKGLLYGPFLIPDMLIYRHDDKLGEYYIRFKKEQIELIANKFNKDRNSNNINFQHSNKMVQAFVAQNWIIEDNQDNSNKYGFDLPVGTWFGSVKVDDLEFWNTAVVGEEVKGFSVEVAADMTLALSKNKQTQMENNEIKLASANLVDGTPIYFDGTLAQDTLVFSDEAMTVPAVDGDYELENGDAIKVAGGKVAEYIVAEIAEGDMADAPVDAPTVAGITADDVAAMIDARFAELSDEINKLKDLIDAPIADTAEMKAQIEALETKLAITPAVKSIVKDYDAKLESQFAKDLDMVKRFSKTNK